MAQKIHLPNRSATGTTPTMERGILVMEFEVKGRLIAREKLTEEQIEMWVEWFDEKYKLSGVMYSILPSKMNFDPTIGEDD